MVKINMNTDCLIKNGGSLKREKKNAYKLQKKAF